MPTTQPQWVTTSHFNFDYFSFSSACLSYQTAMKKLLGFPFNYKYQDLDIYYDEHNFKQHEGLLEKSPNLIKEQIDFIENQSAKLIEASKKYGTRDDFESFSAWYTEYVEFLPTLGLVVAPERVLIKKIKTFLSDEDFAAVSFSDETATAHELRSLLEIAASDESGKDLDDQISEHLENYSWLGNKWMTYSPFKVADIRERIEANKGKAEQRLMEMAATREKMDAKLQDVLNRLSLEQRELIELYRKLLYWRSGRGEAAALSCSLTTHLFTWVGQQVGLNRSQVTRYSFSELKDLFDKGLTVENPDARHSFSAVMIDGDLKVEWDSKQASEKQASHKSAESFTGIVASKGIARGRVRIIHDLPDLKHFVKGEILVAASTNPNMVTAMEKAAAFVTDVGGLTSHAAIISRELNVPCIIGTKIATQVLKDGDMIEVNGDTGIIKKL